MPLSLHEDTNNQLKVGYLNSHGIMGKHRQLSLLFKNFDLDLIFLSETWLHGEMSSGIPNTICDLREQYVSGRGTGGILCVAKDAQTAAESSAVEWDPQNRWVIIKYRNILFVPVYFAPNSQVHDHHFHNMWDRVLFHSRKGKDPCFLLGDFNTRLGEITGDTFHGPGNRVRILHSWLEHPDWLLAAPTEGKWTFHLPHRRSIPDHVFCTRKGQDMLNSYVVEEDGAGFDSDHSPLLLSIQLENSGVPNFQRVNINKLKVDSVKKAFLEELRLGRSEVMSSLIRTRSELEQRWMNNPHQHISEEESRRIVDGHQHEFENWVRDAAVKQCGITRFKTSDMLPAMTKEFEELIDSFRLEKNRLNKLDDLSPEAVEAWQNCRALARRIKKAERDLDNTRRDEQVEKWALKCNRSEFFRSVSRLAKRGRRSQQGLRMEDADSHMLHFQRTFGGAPSGDDFNVDPFVIEAVQNSTKILMPAPHVKASQVLRVLGKLPLRKAPGPDRISNEELRAGAEEIAGILCVFFDIVMMLGVIPVAWNSANIIPIYKNKGDPADIKNYRPIALTSCIRKVYEAVLLNELKSHAHLLDPAQGGFRANRATVDQVIVLNEICHANPNSIHAFLDIQTAYDTVDRRILWSTLMNQFGIPLGLVRELAKLMEGNQVKVLLGKDVGISLSATRGLLQGSTLSPLLFNFFINGLIKRLHENGPLVRTHSMYSNNLFFADDAAVHANSETEMQSLLDICDDWSKQVGIRFAPSKCAILTCRDDYTNGLRLGQELIPREESFKYLGVWFSAHGIDGRLQAEHRARAMLQVSNLLTTKGMHARGWRQSSSIAILKQFLLPSLEYGLGLGILDELSLKTLQKAQNAALRKMLTLPPNTSIGAMHRYIFLPPVAYRNKLLTIKFAARISKLVTTQQESLLGKLAKAELPDSSPLKNLMRMGDQRDWPGTQAEVNAIKTLGDKLGNVADAIGIQHDGSPHPCVEANWLTKEHQHAISRWLLGNVAFHQPCKRCNMEVSRLHALVCSGADNIVRRWISGASIVFERSTANLNVLDRLLRSCKFDGRDRDFYSVMISFNAIEQIRKVCLGWILNKNNVLVYPGHPSLSN